MGVAQRTRVMYRLVGRYMDGVQVVGYQMIDINGNSIRARKEDVEQLAMQGLIENCRVIQYNGVNYIKGVGIKIADLPALNLRTGLVKNNKLENGNSISTMVIVARLMDGTSVIGYIVQDAAGRQYKLSKEKVWQLAREKAISNAIAQVSNKQKILRGVGLELRDLPAIQV